MASSKLVTTNPDLPRQSSICSLSSILADLQNNTNNTNINTNNHKDPNSGADDPPKALGSMNMDDLLKSVYSSSSSDPNNNPNLTHLPPDPYFHAAAAAVAAAELGTKTADEVWQEMVEGGDQRRMGTGESLEAMTLEDFLAKAGAVREEDVRGVPTGVPGHASFPPPTVAINGGAQFSMPPQVQCKEVSSMEVFGNGIDGTVVGVAASAGRGKRRVVDEPVDKATLQKQRRMIKNRESAARSRERKQAYTVELETMVTQLEAENAKIVREMAEKKKQRYKQLMEILIPVVEMREPKRKIRRVNSAHW